MNSAPKAYVYLLPGETANHDEPIIDGRLIFTDYRLVVVTSQPSNVWSVPIALLWKAEVVNLTYLKLTTKLALSVMCAFDAELTCERCAQRINALIDSSGTSLESAFCHTFCNALRREIPNHPFLSGVSRLLWDDDRARPESEFILREFKRMNFQDSWKISEANKEFRICSTYPEYHIVPIGIPDSAVANMAEFRTHKRFPSVVWRSQTTGAVLLRCAQPCVGLMFYRNQHDEQFMASVSKSCRENPGSKSISGPTRLLIVDARTYRVAQLKRLLGGGSEHPDYYDQAQVCFMNMPNLHAVRLSFERLTQLYTLDTDMNWYSMLEKTSWLNYIAQLIKSAVDIAFALEVDGRPVMVHCTDGWDRTAQLSSLAQLLADPYYRTMEGFTVLVEREWLYFGHKFADRCGQGGCNAYPDERSPIFLQWLDCVHQIRRQFPNDFEFSETFLVKLGLHIYSGLFGTFLCNSEESRQNLKLNTRTCSVWALLSPRLNPRVLNPFYKPGNQRLITPSCGLPNLCLWDNLYRHALFPGSRNVMGIVCLNEARTAPMRLECESEMTPALAATVCSPTDSGPPTTLTTADSTLTDQQPAAIMDESVVEEMPALPEFGALPNRNCLGDLTNTTRNTDCGLSPFSVDGPFVVEQKQTVFPDPSPSVCMKRNSDNLSVDGTVAILPLSSVTKGSSDWSISVAAARHPQSNRLSRDSVDEMVRLNELHPHEVSDWSNQSTYPDNKRLSFVDDCNEVFFPDEDTPFAVTAPPFKTHCRHTGGDELGFQLDTMSSDRPSSTTGPPPRLNLLSTSPLSINSAATDYLSIQAMAGGEEVTRSAPLRSGRCRTPPDAHSFCPLGSMDSQRGDKSVSTPVAAPRRKSLDNLGHIVYSPDTDDPSDTSDFTVHSLPEGELLITETSFGNEEPQITGELTMQTADQTDDSYLLPVVHKVAPADPRALSSEGQTLSEFGAAYFVQLHVSAVGASNRPDGTPPTTTTPIVEALDPSHLTGPNTHTTRLGCGSNDCENGARPVSAPISPTLHVSTVEFTACLPKAQSTGQSCVSSNSHISSTPTLQSAETNGTVPRIPRYPDWDGFPMLNAQLTTYIHSDDSTRCVAQKCTIDRLDEELRSVRQELEMQRHETENLRQQLAALQASQKASEPVPIPKSSIGVAQKTGFVDLDTVREDQMVAATVPPTTTVTSTTSAIRSPIVDSPTNVMTSQSRNEPATLDVIEDVEEVECDMVKSTMNAFAGPSAMFSSAHLDVPEKTDDLACRLAKALNDSVAQDFHGRALSTPFETPTRNRVSHANASSLTPSTCFSVFVSSPSSNGLFSAVSANDLTSPYSAISLPASSRCRSAGTPRTSATATSAATSDGMAQA